MLTGIINILFHRLLEIHTIFKAIFILIQDPIVFITNRSGNLMVSGDKLSLAAIIALDMMEVEDYQLYMASHEYQRAVVCVWDSDDYFRVLESAASKAGLCLTGLFSSMCNCQRQSR